MNRCGYVLKKGVILRIFGFFPLSLFCTNHFYDNGKINIQADHRIISYFRAKHESKICCNFKSF